MKGQSTFSRRSFLKGMTLAGLSTGLGFNLTGCKKTTPNGKTTAHAKNLILMVSDGMNNGTFSAVNHWYNAKENRDSAWMQLYKDELASRHLVETSCANSMVTDSAAASSAWGIGHRVNMGSINTQTDGSQPKPIAMLAKAKGKSAGMVSTARITHATPAGFAANVTNRDFEDEIASQYLKRGIDVLLGGGDKKFNSKNRKDHRDLYGEFSKTGYRVTKNKTELKALQKGSKPILGVFSKSHMPYCIDRQKVEKYSDVPSLEEMTQVALDHLSQNPKGFVLQIEAGRVDHAGHANDPSILHEQLEYDRTVALVREFAEKDGDTLVIVTTDHGTGGFMVNGADDGYEKALGRMLEIEKVTGSFDTLESRTNRNDVPASIVKAVEDTLKIQLTKDERAFLVNSVSRDASHSMYGASNAIANALHPILFKRFSVMWTSHNHTADLVEMAIYGPGKDGLPGFVENWEVHGLMRQVLGI
jgi:alkaline phosphatase